MKLKVIITGSTGMVGEGVLHECLQHPNVEKILVINRRPCGISNPKLFEIIHTDFFDFSQIENQLSGFNSCFFCLGVSSVRKKEQEYFSLTHTLTMYIAQKMIQFNPSMIFCYISSTGANSEKKGGQMWARIKGMTEDDLMKLPFKRVYVFRPAILNPTKGLMNYHKFYSVFKFFYPFFRLTFPKYVSTLRELGLAMINSATKGYEKQILEVSDIVKLSKQ